MSYRELYEINKEDIDLTSFDIKDHLNDKLFTDDKLNVLARRKLLLIAKDFISGFDIADFGIEDVILIGSLANYNWDEKYSDIDLHIVVDFEDINDDVDLVREFFNAVKNNWNRKHENINIYGYPVEVYVQDINDTPKTTGVYSILYDKWLTKPSVDKMKTTYDKEYVKDKVSDFINQIDEIEERYLLSMDEIGEDDIEDILNDADDLFTEIKDTRNTDLGASKTEMSAGNLIFKSLRRNGYLEKLNDVRTKLYDELYSLE